MNSAIRRYHLFGAVLLFVLLPVTLLALTEYPRRTLLKEAISLLTVLAFAATLGQLFLAKSNRYFVSVFRFSRVLAVHKFIGYAAAGLFLVHPFLLVLPRFYESGVAPFDALITILTTVDSPGVVLGLIAWSLMLLIGVTSLFRERMNMSYRRWRWYHGILSILFIVIASWHAIELGRHTGGSMSVFITLLALTGSLLLVRQYADQINAAVGAKQ
jgi:predicted ferric reductase